MVISIIPKGTSPGSFINLHHYMDTTAICVEINIADLYIHNFLKIMCIFKDDEGKNTQNEGEMGYIKDQIDEFVYESEVHPVL